MKKTKRVLKTASTLEKKTSKSFPFTLNGRPDTVDFRDLMFVPTLIEVPQYMDIKSYRVKKIPVLNQGKEGACTGYALATAANYLLRTREHDPDKTQVSPQMFYEFAKKYDEWPGEDYSGSSARGAMKAWHKHGICSDEVWKKSRGGKRDSAMELIQDSQVRPLGAYFRVNHSDLVAMHSAMAEVNILYVTSYVHPGWQSPDPKTGEIKFDPANNKRIGGHAFVIVAYDREGFWIQNSWGEGWGLNGLGKISYDDWLLNGTDAWVARLGVPVNITSSDAKSIAFATSGSMKNEASFYDLRPHVISLGNDGKLKPDGTYGNSEQDVDKIVNFQMDEKIKDWKTKRILIYAHGGLVPEDSILQRLSDYRETLLNNQVYPLFFVWHTGFWDTIKDILGEALSQRKSEGLLGGIKDFMLDRFDDTLEPIARPLGKSLWDEMKENALRATVNDTGGARFLIDKLVKKIGNRKDYEIHLVGHSAGSIFLAPVVQYLTGGKRISTGPMKNKAGLGINVGTCTLWAPACTSELFLESYKSSIENGTIGDFNLYTLTDDAENDDNCGKIYNKSLLYLVSNSFEKEPRIPLIRPLGVPIFGMEKFLSPEKLGDDQEKKKMALDIRDLFSKKDITWVKSPDRSNLSNSTQHGGFDDDIATVKSTLSIVMSYSNKPGAVKMSLNEKVDKLKDVSIRIKPSATSIKERKNFLVSKLS